MQTQQRAMSEVQYVSLVQRDEMLSQSNSSVRDHILGIANCVVWRDDDVCTPGNDELMADEHLAVRC